MDKALARRWVAGHAAAQRRALEVMREEGPLPPDVSFARAMELMDLVSEENRFREGEVAQVRVAWAKLKAWAAGRNGR